MKKRKSGVRIVCGSTKYIHPLYDPNWGRIRKKQSKKEKKYETL